MKHVHVDFDPVLKAVQELYAEHGLLTIICGFFAVMMTLSFYRMLKSISPGLVAFIFLLLFGILVMHWTVTRTEPPVLKPAIDFIAPFFPSPTAYPSPSPAPALAKPGNH
jgi:hypothetical protein